MSCWANALEFFAISRNQTRTDSQLFNSSDGITYQPINAVIPNIGRVNDICAFGTRLYLVSSGYAVADIGKELYLYVINVQSSAQVLYFRWRLYFFESSNNQWKTANFYGMQIYPRAWDVTYDWTSRSSTK